MLQVSRGVPRGFLCLGGRGEHSEAAGEPGAVNKRNPRVDHIHESVKVDI